MNKLHNQGYSLSTVCDFVDITRQAYYKRIKNQNDKAHLYSNVEGIVIKNRKVKARSGLRSIYYKENLQRLLGVNQFERQMSERGYALKPQKSYIKTTDSRGHYYKFANLISGISINNENRVIVGDLTYYQNQTGIYYIFHFNLQLYLEMRFF